MKLYTEEQVKSAFKIGMRENYIDEQNVQNFADKAINYLSPIELPSDEEIKEYLKKTHTKAVNPLNVYYKTGFESGAIWMKEQILKPNYKNEEN